ncbi:MAG: VCBS repeat-containing protein, partial [Candidatus Azobacteroides sp.]|nr:VCBS repeat-containing protein [Candidatus Azobacteroides sp.]
MKKKITLFAIISLVTWCLSGSFLYATPVAKSGNMVIHPTSNSTLNVLRDCAYECSASEVNVTIVTPPVHGTATVNNVTRMIIYSHSTPGAFLEDSFQYKISCSGEDSNVATIYLHPGTKPDNMVEDVCHVDPTGFQWAIGQPIKSTVNARSDRPWLLGDLDDINDPDNKGLPELVALGEDLNKEIVIFPNGDVTTGLLFDLKALSGVTTDFYHYNTTSIFALSRFNNGKGAIVIMNSDGYLYAFEYDYPNLTFKYKSDESWVQRVIPGNSLSSNIALTSSTIGFTDFDGDGNTEIYIGNKIFSLNGLQFLTGLNPEDNQGFSSQHATQTTGSGISLALDIDRDGFQELIVGNEIYKVENNGGVWSMSLYKTITPPDITVFGNTFRAKKDGRVSVADFNGDGHVDVLINYVASISNTFETSYAVFYAWDVYNDKILFSHVEEEITCCSYPLIGDIDGDGELEIAGTFSYLDWTLTTTAELKAFKLPAVFSPSATLDNKWNLPIYETSTRTGMSLFDFNLDGIMEIVYRDMENLRIMTVEGNTLKNLLETPSYSGTTWEMPLIADIDNDGAAEIVCVSGTSSAVRNVGPMEIYKSGNEYAWAPARKVWNQY